MLVSRTGIEPIPTRYLVPFLVLESALTARRGFTDGELLYISASVGRTWWATLRVHPHKQDASFRPQKFEDLRTLGAFLLGDFVHVMASEIQVARICTASSSPAVCTLAFGTPL